MVMVLVVLVAHAIVLVGIWDHGVQNVHPRLHVPDMVIALIGDVHVMKDGIIDQPQNVQNVWALTNTRFMKIRYIIKKK